MIAVSCWRGVRGVGVENCVSGLIWHFSSLLLVIVRSSVVAVADAVADAVAVDAFRRLTRPW